MLIRDIPTCLSPGPGPEGQGYAACATRIGKSPAIVKTKKPMKPLISIPLLTFFNTPEAIIHARANAGPRTGPAFDFVSRHACGSAWPPAASFDPLARPAPQYATLLLAATACLSCRSIEGHTRFGYRLEIEALQFAGKAFLELPAEALLKALQSGF